jgi:hypothetical protein
MVIPKQTRTMVDFTQDRSGVLEVSGVLPVRRKPARLLPKRESERHNAQLPPTCRQRRDAVLAERPDEPDEGGAKRG